VTGAVPDGEIAASFMGLANSLRGVLEKSAIGT
jgi:hypothetical protein